MEIARYASFSEAAGALNMTKGAISYRVKTLEDDLGHTLFLRTTRGVSLTDVGKELELACRTYYEEIETQINSLKAGSASSLTVGVSTYFAARWLSPRLMSFIQKYPDIQLRLQPMTRLFDLEAQGVDIAIRWGHGQWDDVEILPFMALPAFPVGNSAALEQSRRSGIKSVIQTYTLLSDHDDSNAWTDWLTTANLPHQTRRNTLIIPDPNVRVQAVMDGQGIALMDEMVDPEIIDGRLFRLSDIELSDYGYFLANPKRAQPKGAAENFIEWIFVTTQLPI